MSLLLKSDPLVTALSLYDIRGAPGVAADISHINTNSTVKGFEQDQWVSRLFGWISRGRVNDWLTSDAGSRMP